MTGHFFKEKKMTVVCRLRRWRGRRTGKASHLAAQAPAAGSTAAAGSRQAAAATAWRVRAWPDGGQATPATRRGRWPHATRTIRRVRDGARHDRTTLGRLAGRLGVGEDGWTGSRVKTHRIARAGMPCVTGRLGGTEF